MLRPLRPEDAPLLETATLGTMNWCGERFTRTDVRSRPEFRHYTHMDTSRGDFGVVATKHDAPIGVVWALFLPAHDPGYGFVSATIPELSLWVDAHARGQGLGRTLLRALVSEAMSRGLAQLSLSVEAGNVARQLYLSEGFRDVPGRDADGVMLLSLRAR